MITNIMRKSWYDNRTMLAYPVNTLTHNMVVLPFP